MEAHLFLTILVVVALALALGKTQYDYLKLAKSITADLNSNYNSLTAVKDSLDVCFVEFKRIDDELIHLRHAVHMRKSTRAAGPLVSKTRVSKTQVSKPKAVSKI